jgi:hypothetical protein
MINFALSVYSTCCEIWVIGGADVARILVLLFSLIIIRYESIRNTVYLV